MSCELFGWTEPLEKSAFFSFEPPVFFLQFTNGRFIKHYIHEVSANFGGQQREIADARGLNIVTFKASVRIGRKFFAVDADF